LAKNQKLFEEFSIEQCKEFIEEDESGDHLKMRIKVVEHLVNMVKSELSAQDQSFKEILSQVKDD
jgi:hypothetical protein